MSHRTTSALVLLTAGTLAMTAVTTPAAFAANSPEESQPGTPAPTSSVDAQSGAPQSGTGDEAGAPNPTTTPESFPADDTPTTMFYHDASGAQASGWVKDGSSWYYLNPTTRQMVTGWILDGPTWCYLSTDSGAMYTGGHWIGWKWYYFNESGQLVG